MSRDQKTNRIIWHRDEWACEFYTDPSLSVPSRDSQMAFDIFFLLWALADFYCLNVALYRDETKLHSFRGSQASNWDKGSIKGLGWSEDEKLLVLTADGTVRCYYDLQGDFTQFSLGHGAEEYGVTACRFVILDSRVFYGCD
jgi:WD40 repeat protein